MERDEWAANTQHNWPVRMVFKVYRFKKYIVLPIELYLENIAIDIPVLIYSNKLYYIATNKWAKLPLEGPIMLRFAQITSSSSWKSN